MIQPCGERRRGRRRKVHWTDWEGKSAENALVYLLWASVCKPTLLRARKGKMLLERNLCEMRPGRGTAGHWATSICIAIHNISSLDQVKEGSAVPQRTLRVKRKLSRDEKSRLDRRVTPFRTSFCCWLATVPRVSLPLYTGVGSSNNLSTGSPRAGVQA